MREKVYCSECKHYFAGGDGLLISCEKAVKYTMMPGSPERRPWKIPEQPWEKNKNNKCRDWEAL